MAEAAKVIENTQRDVNIALINELAMIFDRMGLNTNDVIDAASTKWNFVRLYPGWLEVIVLELIHIIVAQSDLAWIRPKLNIERKANK